MKAIIAFLIFFPGDAPPNAAEPKEAPSAFKMNVQGLLQTAAFGGMEFGVIAPFTFWEELDHTAELKGFSESLRTALETPGSPEHEVAVEFVETYVAVARVTAWSAGQSDLAAAAARSLGSQAQAIETRLEALLGSRNAGIRWKAADAIMALRPPDRPIARARAIYVLGMDTNDAVLRQHVCSRVGIMRYASDESVKLLIRGIRDKDADVRTMAANALYQLGPAAKQAVPALVGFLKTGPDAVGDLSPRVMAMAIPRPANLALAALGMMEADGAPAVAEIVRRLPRATVEEQAEMLHCLTMIGPAARSARPVVESLLTNDDLRLAAACTRITIAPDPKLNVGFEAMVTRELTSGDAKRRDQAVAVCAEFGPPSRAVAAALVPMLDDDLETNRIAAARALASIGPFAEEAIPGLEKMLSEMTNGMDRTFLSHVAAASALRKIGRKSVPALLRVMEMEDNDAPEYVLKQIGEFCDDDAVLDRVIQLADRKTVVPAPNPADGNLPDDWLRRSLERQIALEAAYTLGSLGERARRARPALERLRDRVRGKMTALERLQSDAFFAVAAEIALSNIPE